MPIGSLIGGLIGQGGANAAAGAYGKAGQNADFTRRLNEGTLSPWYQSGQDASNVMSELMGLGHYVPDGQGYGGQKLDAANWQGDQANAFSKFQASPDYNFRLSEGTKALDRSAASQGMLLSGAQTKATQQYGGNLASGEYNNWFSKLAGLSGQGLTAAGGDVASNNNALTAGNAALSGQASSYSNAANALANGVSGAVNSAANIFAMAGGFGGLGGGSGVTAGPAPAGGYGGYAGYANTLPGFGSV